MDLSNSGKTRPFRRELIKRTPLMVGTVPIYDAIGYNDKPLVELTAQDFLDVVEAHAEDGVDFMTNSRGVQLVRPEHAARDQAPDQRGIAGAHPCVDDDQEKRTRFTSTLTGARDHYYDHDVTISLGDAHGRMSTYDATDATRLPSCGAGQLGRAWEKGVQVVVEGPGHMALDKDQGQHEAAGSACAMARRSTCWGRSWTSRPATTT